MGAGLVIRLRSIIPRARGLTTPTRCAQERAGWRERMWRCSGGMYWKRRGGVRKRRGEGEHKLVVSGKTKPDPDTSDIILPPVSASLEGHSARMACAVSRGLGFAPTSEGVPAYSKILPIGRDQLQSPEGTRRHPYRKIPQNPPISDLFFVGRSEVT
ncbi:hypothetical protein C8J57DRAFT_1226304 [Mycena rebaudengoi]|nr:hypothetical protein C8J57DRAFT_1226304 [Mycena rebaudengoi]